MKEVKKIQLEVNSSMTHEEVLQKFDDAICSTKFVIELDETMSVDEVINIFETVRQEVNKNS